MARAFPQSSPSDFGQEPQPGEWQALRGELVALLDQVEGQVARASRSAPGYDQLGERMRDLRFQVADNGPGVPPDRRREALRSVQRAVDRFHERDETGFASANPRDSLQSAIDQIRSRHDGPAPRIPGAPSDLPVLGELSRAVGGISERLERLEIDLKTQARANGSVKDIADQVAQLSHVVELLAGAVGEAGQVKRLEGQIASLAKLVSQGPQTDLSALFKRIDDVSATVGRLADLQVEFANRIENPAQSAVFKDGMAAIEASVRNVYDRIDTIERSASVSPEHIDHLTAEMARFTEVMRSSATPPQNMIELLDALNSRISDIENQEGVVAALKGDIDALRLAVIGAVEPRFSAIENRLGTLSAQLSERASDPGVGQLEAQVRQLVARMDQTGEQLSGLAKLYSYPAEPAPAPDFNVLADMVATRAMAMTREGSATSSATDAGLRALEARMTQLFESASSEKPQAEFDQMQDGIREVNERLARLETSLLKAREEVSSPLPSPRVFDAPMPPQAVFEAPIAAPRPVPAPIFSASAEPEAAIVSPVAPAKPRSDFMPTNPVDEAPLNAPAFPDAMPVNAALEVKNGPRKRHPGLDHDEPVSSYLEVARGFAAPEFDSGELPPAPRSSFGAPEDQAFASSTMKPALTAAEPDTSPAPSRNTFIEAHRRAQRQAQAPVEANANSLIGRALARFQSNAAQKQASLAAAAEVKPVEAKGLETKPAKPAKIKLSRAERKLAGDKAARTEWAPETPEATAVIAPVEPMLPGSAIEAAGEESFLSRHRKPILLTAAVVALAFLTLNLVMQRLNADEPAAESDVSAPAVTDTQPVTKTSSLTAPRVIPMVDSLTTGSIDHSAAQSFSASPLADMPAAFQAGEASATPLATPPATPLASLPDVSDGPVKVELPPDNLGPLELREAAANGDPRAQFEVAAIYTEGRAVKQDFIAAATWYERSAAQGFAPAQYRLGNLYENGDGVGKDMEQARLWYERAAEAGNRMSMHNLAALYAGGALGTQAFDSAAKWFEEAAARGMTDSQFNLGMLYARGLGVPQSLEASYKWFALAALSGDKDAAKSRDDIARSLDAETVSKLAADVAAWKPAPIDLAANFAPIGTWSDKFDPGETIASKDIVARVQSALQRLGFDVGAPDGVSGPKTAEAIKAFEAATGMSASGAINPRLLAVLGSQPA